MREEGTSEGQAEAAREASSFSKQGELRIVTWNIAAINNNPFEYYATLDGEDGQGYERIMIAVQDFIDSPGVRDVEVSEVFTPAMFQQLKDAMLEEGWSGVDKVEELWLNDFGKRCIISGFLKDKELGSKRLASMPDRFTNTINNADGTVVCRPTVINNYQCEMSNLQAWFDQWFEFMFCTKVSVKNRHGAVEAKKVCALLQPIKRAKYPAITEEEEGISIPLQTLGLAIFDAILVHIMNASPTDWYPIKMKLCSALVVHKQANVIKVLTEQAAYFNADVIFLQEVAGAFVEAFYKSERLSGRFALLTPKSVDHVRDQNSLVLVAKSRLAAEVSACEELTIGNALASDVPVADGDICAFAAPLLIAGNVKRDVVLASFHGDTAGLASTPVVSGLRKIATGRSAPLILGLDANTHARWDPKGSTKHIDEFLRDLQAGDAPLSHCWAGDETSKWHTTFNARTYLQPQLNKAVPFAERQGSKLTDCNPKDFILFSGNTFEVVVPAVRDNTGHGEFVEGMDFPTLTFPSDHAIVATTLRLCAPLCAM